jgi:hypothetical protein
MNQPTNIYDLKKSANELRQSKKYLEARDAYNNIWLQDKDDYVGAGLLNCLRKLDLYEDAVRLAEELEERCEGLDWL